MKTTDKFYIGSGMNVSNDFSKKGMCFLAWTILNSAIKDKDVAFLNNDNKFFDLLCDVAGTDKKYIQELYVQKYGPLKENKSLTYEYYSSWHPGAKLPKEISKSMTKADKKYFYDKVSRECIKRMRTGISRQSYEYYEWKCNMAKQILNERNK